MTLSITNHTAQVKQNKLGLSIFCSAHNFTSNKVFQTAINNLILNANYLHMFQLYASDSYFPNYLTIA